MAVHSFLADKPTLAEIQATRRATAKYDLPTKLGRAVDKKQAKRDDARQLHAWALAVKVRDGFKDRKTGQRLKRTRELDPLRAEAHHIEPKSNLNTRYDVRNGITLSFHTHDAVERNRLQIVGTTFFVKGGTRYIDATSPVRFKEIA